MLLYQQGQELLLPNQRESILAARTIFRSFNLLDAMLLWVKGACPYTQGKILL